jgi:folate-binding protein YgfZ
MELSWKTHLETMDAIINENTVIHFGDPDTELKNIHSNKVTIADLSHYSLIKISGSEAQSFLQSQFSNDVSHVSESQAQLNSYCSPKGRVLVIFNLFQIGSDYFLQLPEALLDSILKRLTMFKMRADVDLTDVTNSIQCIGISGLQAETILKTNFTKVPNSHFECITVQDDFQNSVSLIRISNESNTQAQPRFLLFAEPESLISFWRKNTNNLQAVGYAPWSLLDIQAGIPTINTETVEAFIPQMINLQLINAVSFKKGCYPGQEIVARTQYLGKLKKRMYLLTSDYEQIIEPGTDLSTTEASDDQSKGKIVNCQLNQNGGIDALAVLQINSINQGNVIVKSSPNIIFSIQELPYSFDEV